MNQGIIMPRIFRRRSNNRQETIGGELGLDNGANSFLKGSIVVLSSGILAACATDAVLACGIVPDASHTTGVVNPPDAIYAGKHWPFDLNGLQFLINVGHLSSNALVVGEANSAKQLSDVSIGTSYGIARATSGAYAGYQVLDPTETTNTLLTVIDKPYNVTRPFQTEATYNGLVLVEVISSKIQNL